MTISRRATRRWIPAMVVAAAGTPAAAQTATAHTDAAPPAVLERPARLDVSDVPLSHALSRLSETAGLVIAFSPSLLKATGNRVSCACAGVTVDEALRYLLRGTAFIYTVVRGQIIVTLRDAPESDEDRLLDDRATARLTAPRTTLASLPLRSAPTSLAQERTVTGVVEDTRGRPVVGAQVTAAGTAARAMTDVGGRFRLAGLPAGEVTIRVAMIGYRPLTRVVGPGDGDVRLVMTDSPIDLDELVVTGTPGSSQLRALGTTVGRVRAAELEAIAPTPTPHALLSSEVPGLHVTAGRGEIGGGALVRIRGASSMSLSSQPLLYIDGVRVNNNPADGGGVGGGDGVATSDRAPPSRLDDLNADDIESIEVIKGPAAATLYGTEATNGVIQVITKKGRRGRPAFNLTVKQGGNWIPDPENLFPTTAYRSSTGEVVDFNVLRHDRTIGFPVSLYGVCPDPYEQVGDRCKGSPFRTGLSRALGGNVSGGSDDLRYYVSLDAERDEGPVSYNWQNRLSGRANLTWTPNEKLTVDVGFGNARSRLQSASPTQPITTHIIWGCPAPGCEPGSGAPSAADGPRRGYLAYTPEVFEREMEGLVDLNRATATLTLSHQPAHWFTQRLTAGGDFTYTRHSELFRRNVDGFGGYTNQGARNVLTAQTQYLNVDYAATATASVGSHLRFATSGGVQYYAKQNQWVLAAGSIFAAREIETVTGGASRASDEDYLENKTLGAYVQEQLAWKDRLFATVALRGDDNSAFGRNFDFVAYPKVSVSWVASDEPFLARLPGLSALKLRAAWGEAGQQPDVFAALRTYAPQPGPGGAAALTPASVGNPDLEPEVGREIELGFDAGLLDDRLGLEVTWYDKKTTNAIVRVPALRSLGFPGFQFQNLGEVSNRGLELLVRATPLRRDGVELQLHATYARNRNEVVDIGGGAPISMGAGQFHLPGFPIGSIFFKRVVSADIVDNGGQRVATNVMCEGGALEPNSPLSRGGGPPMPCDQAPAVYWGQPVPTWNGAVGATLTLFRRLQLYGLTEFVGGHRLTSSDLSGAHLSFRNSRAILERTDPILLGYESLGSAVGGGGTRTIDAGFAKLRRVSATYNLPDRWARYLSGSRATLTVSAENLWTMWVAQRGTFGHRQTDPEVHFTGAGVFGTNDPGGLLANHGDGWPPLRRFLLTLRMAF